MKKTAVIIDDERLARAELKKMLQEHPEIEILAEAANANEGIELIHQLDPQVIFLDIQMPEKNGFEMLQEIERLPINAMPDLPCLHQTRFLSKTEKNAGLLHLLISDSSNR